MSRAPASDPIVTSVVEWYATAERDLPWRRPDTTAWGVMVSEFMLQQTPVVRVVPVYEHWVSRWPTPAALAADSSGEAVRAWGRLGYPRRALRLHAAATLIVDQHGGDLPTGLDELLALPGVGEYTAAAIASFAHGQRHVVLDTNIRRVLARAVGGEADATPHPTRAERARAATLLPQDGAARWNAAVMELGALVCTAKAPACAACPLQTTCAWRAAGQPARPGPPRRGQAWAGTDRMVRGRLMAVLRDHPGPVEPSLLDAVWDDAVQRDRALTSLLADGLVVAEDGRYRLPN